MKLVFLLGEKRRVYLDISAIGDLDFTIHAGSYKLICSGNVEASEDCVIHGHTLSALIKPQKRGRYDLRFQYEIGDEVFKENVEIEVR